MRFSYQLSRFIDVQAHIFDIALSEIKAGRKTSHWMWYVFPQIKGLGSSSTSIEYSIKSLDEAKAYINHPILGKRYMECVEALLSLKGLSAIDIFDYVDAMKLRSSLTLFYVASEDKRIKEALDMYFPEGLDEKTVSILSSL